MNRYGPDVRLATVARRQHGVFSHEQVLRLGFTEAMIRSRVRTGRWIRLAGGIYLLPGSLGTFTRQCWAAVLATRGSVAGGLAAACYLGLTDFRPCHREIVVPRGTVTRNPFATVRRFDGARSTRRDGLPVTTPAQTLFDVAPRVSILKLERALDDHLLAHRHVDLRPFEERLTFYEGWRRPGIGLMRSLIEERREVGWQAPESELERVAIRLLRRLPSRPQLLVQAPLPWRTAAPGRFDVLIPDWATLVEADSRRWHARLRDFERDRWRDNEAVAHGLRPLRFTWTHVTQRPADVLEIVERTGRLAA